MLRSILGYPFLYDRLPTRLGRCTHKLHTCPEQVGIAMVALCNVDVDAVVDAVVGAIVDVIVDSVISAVADAWCNVDVLWS